MEARNTELQVQYDSALMELEQSRGRCDDLITRYRDQEHDDGAKHKALLEQVEMLTQVKQAFEVRCEVLKERLDLDKNLMEEVKLKDDIIRNLKDQATNLRQNAQAMKQEMSNMEKDFEQQISKVEREAQEVLHQKQQEIVALRTKSAIISEWMVYQNSTELSSSPTRTRPAQLVSPSQLRGGSAPSEASDAYSSLVSLKAKNRELQKLLEKESLTTSQMQQDLKKIKTDYDNFVQ